jgi:hypothetical protein
MRENIQGAVRLVGYSYDHLNRLTRESLHSNTDWATETGAVAYDATPGYSDAGFDEVGNRRQRIVTGSFPGLASGTTSYSAYTLNDCLGPIQSGTVGASFDPNGNTIQLDLNADGAGDFDGADEFGLENRLSRRKVTSPIYSGGKRWIELAYDGDGNRVSKTLKDWQPAQNPAQDPPSSTLVTRFVVDDLNLTGYAQVMEERDGSGNTLVAYVH